MEMASSDEEAETVPTCVSDYEFFSGNDEAISFAKLPVKWNKGETHDGKQQQIFLSGKTDNGLRKIFMRVIAWKFDLSCKKPEISVLSVKSNWIKLLKPRNCFQDVVRTTQITVHFLHFIKWNPQRSQKALWDHLNKVFSTLERRPSEDDLVDHLPLINEAVKRDETLANSQLLTTFLKEKPRKRKTFNEGVKPPFIVDDASENEDHEYEIVEENEDDESDEDDCFDSVCAICDNGGHILICEGKCMRSFHATVEDGDESNCESLGFTDEELEAIKNVAFYCENCKSKQHQCFACGELGSSDESSGAEVFCCVNGACGHFYHPHCVAKLLHPGNTAAAEEHRQRIAAGEQFACPAHKCHVCNELEVRSSPELQFAMCRRCPRSYHRKCLPRETAFEKDVDEAQGVIQRAWEDLIPNRILIYCLDHEIDPDISTPIRDHIKFPDSQTERKKELAFSSKKKDLLMKRGSVLEDNAGKRISARPPKGVDKLPSSSKQRDLSRKRVEKLPVQGCSKKQKVASDTNSLGKLKESTNDEGDISLGDRLHDTFYGMDSEPEKSSRGESAHETEVTKKVKPTAKRTDNSLPLDADARKRILSLMRDASSSITLDQVKQRHRSPSTHTQYTKLSADSITLGKVEGSVQALRTALKKLDEGCSVQDAKAVCGNDLLVQFLRWKDKMKVYLAPFLYGMRYTSFGRHFTKVDKLKEVVDMLHWYIQDGDMIVDFCCGSNDFSCLMKKKLDEAGKSCSFKNYDILQAKNDFNFERRDWMGVRPHELPEGSKLIMGLNPPFGVNAALANKFINKALEFKPKLLMLIVPRETQRLDEKESPYDLIWENDQMFIGKSFYLPGSVDINDKQIEDWNVNGPLLYLWGHPDWTAKHKAIAEKHGHLSRAQKSCRLEGSKNEIHVPNSSEECHNHDKSFVNQDDVHPHKPSDQEPGDKVTTSHQEVLLLESNGAAGDKNNALGKNHPEENSQKSGGKRKKNKRSNNMLLEDKFSSRHSVSHHSSPKVADLSSLETYSPKRLETPSHMHSRSDFSTYQPYSQIGYNENDSVRKYGSNGEDPCPSMASRQVFTPSPNPDYGFRVSSDPWTGRREGRANSLGYRSYVGEMIEEYGRDPTIQSHLGVHGQVAPNSWSQRTVLPSNSGPGFPSLYGPLNSSANSSYGGMNTSAMQRYAPRLDELNHGRMSNVVSGPPLQDTRIYHPPAPRPTFQGGPLGFAPGPYRPYSQQNSSGWLNE